MKPNKLNIWRWQSAKPLTPIDTGFVSIIDEDIASQVIRQIPDDRD